MVVVMGCIRKGGSHGRSAARSKTPTKTRRETDGTHRSTVECTEYDEPARTSTDTGQTWVLSRTERSEAARAMRQALRQPDSGAPPEGK